nr:MAG TPA: hypothetical protein [Caudoviricetes sp.]
MMAEALKQGRTAMLQRQRCIGFGRWVRVGTKRERTVLK